MRKNKIIALFQIFVFVFSVFAVTSFSAKDVSGAQVCCEKLKNKDEYCQNVDDSLCDKTFKYAATSCDQTSFCKTGCCFNPGDDGLCYSNYPKTRCDVNEGMFDGSDASCESSAQCQEGCCVVGTESFYVTEARCKLEMKKFPDLEMDFRSDVKNEIDCINVGRAVEKGSCVKDPNDCKYTARSMCDAEQTATTGFFSGEFCSSLDFVNCAPPDKEDKRGHTGCLADSEDVYWFDSCGNPEEVAEDCDYIDGSLCGDSDNNNVFECESLHCDEDDKYLSLNLDDYAGSDSEGVSDNGVNNGESWCLFDHKEQGVGFGGRDRPGSRFYRALCINGKEIVDECGDYRKEWCVDGPVEVDRRAEYGEEQRVFHEARCRENRWQECIDSCNTLQGVDVSEEGDVQEAFKNDLECCMNTDKRDCRWIGPSGGREVKGFGSGKFGLYCVPQVAPGFKTWEDEGSNTCGKANLECEVAFRCAGLKKLAGILTGEPCAQGLFSGKKWEIVYGEDCLKQEWVQSANDLCRSMGDCGADINLNNKVTFTGFSNTPVIDKDFKPHRGPGFLNGLSERRGGQWFDMDETDVRGKLNRFFSDKASAFPFITAVGLGLTYAVVAKTSAAFAFGVVPGAKFSSAFFSPFTKGSTGLGFMDKIFGGKKAMAEATKSFIKEAGDVAAEKVTDAGVGAITKAPNFAQYSEAFGERILEANDVAYKKALSTYNAEFIKDPVKFADMYAAKSPEILAQQKAATASNEAGLEFAASQEKEIAIDAAKEEAVAQGGHSFLKFVSAIMWIWTAYEVINMIMEKQETVTISTTCKDWVAPTPTGGVCETCNPEEYQKNVTINGIEKTVATELRGLLTCSKYKCKSFGQACDVVNEGTEEEKCVTKDPHDVKSPKILFWREGTDERLNVKDQGTIGYSIQNEIPAYDRFFIGIKTDEPAQCKMSFEHSREYDEMESYFFGDETYDYFHTQLLTYPKGVNATKAALTLGAADNEYKIYVRCEDSLSNENEKDFVIDFKIGIGPDLTAPVVEYSSIGAIPGETYIAAGANETALSLFINEPAECRWDTADVDYDTMSSDHQCTTTSCGTCGGLYECKFDKDAKQGNSGPMIKGTADKELIYIYMKCIDQPYCVSNKDPQGNECKRNRNKDSYDLTLRRTQALNITSVGPTNDIYIGGIKGNITLTAETTGGALKNGNAYCGYTTQEVQKENVWAMNAFFDTNSSKHKQVLVPATGTFTYYVGCVDIAGNSDYGSTTFNVKLDTKGPELIRAYEDQSTQPSLFKVEVDEPATCEYDTEKKFNFGDGNLMQADNLTHSAASGFNTYFVLCKDQYGNQGDLATITFFL